MDNLRREQKMLLNFCDPRLRPEIKCSTISTEGHEVTNLISDPCNGFLAYSCIRPPVHIDITFLCNVWLNHIVIWPAVGSQKSSGFQLYSRNTNSDAVPYTLLSTGFLSPSDAGLLFYSTDVDPNEISVPANFLKRYIRSSRQFWTAYTHSVRLTICKTEKSIPALGRIEIWGTVSPRCGKDVVASVHSLLSNYQAATPLPLPECKINITDSTSTENKQEAETSSNLEISENFLDAITWELMTQPITLPSGNVIDQTTLEKHGQNEAIWGRPLSDPFTGIPFNEHRKPVMASALKFRIDQFLLMNSDSEQIKNIPRVLGRDSTSALVGDRRIIEIPKCVLNENSLKRTAENNMKLNAHKQTTSDDNIMELLQRPKRHCHRLPVAVITGPKQSTATIKARLKQTEKDSSSSKLLCNKSNSDNQNNESKILAANIADSLDNSEQILLPNIKRFNTPEKVELHNISSDCKCCSNNVILYKLPCKHVICRKVLLSIADNRCNSCGFLYKVSEIERVHGNILSR